jgi:excisionase family DNA binding protein
MTLSKSFQVSGLIATAEVARQMGVHRSTVWHWIRTGALKAERSGGFLGIKRGELEKFRSIYQTEATSQKPETQEKKPKRKRRKKDE